jgi:hypothetical protein
MSSPFMLKVTVVEARNLKAHTFGGGRDVFVEVRIKDHTDCFKTTIKKNTLNPKWEEEFTLYPKNFETEIFVAKVYGHHSTSSNDLLGEVEIFVAFILDPSKHKDWHPLMNKTGPTTFHPSHGEIMFNLCLFENGILKASHPPVQQIGLGVTGAVIPTTQTVPVSTVQPIVTPTGQPGVAQTVVLPTGQVAVDITTQVPNSQYPPSPQQFPPQQFPPQQYPPSPQQYPPSPQQFPPQQFPPQQFPPQQYPPSPQQFPPQQYSPQQYPPSPQQFPPQQFPPQQFPPQQFPPQQFPPQQFPPQQFPQQFPPQQYNSPMQGRKAIRSIHGKYLMAEEGTLYAHHNLQEHGSKGYFFFETHSQGGISLRTHHGKFVAMDSFKSIYLTPQHSHDTKFIIENFNGYHAFRSHHGTFIALDPYGDVRGTHRVDQNEMFQIIG